MSIWHIYGGNRLTGSTQVQGAKNAVLPIMAASCAISAARRSATGTRCALIPAA